MPLNNTCTFSKQKVLQLSPLIQTLVISEVNNDLKQIVNFHNSKSFNFDIENQSTDGLDKYKNFFYREGSYYDLVILSTLILDKKSIKLCNLIKTINDRQKILIISEHRESRHLIELINIGISGFIAKPISSNDLSSVMRKIYLEIRSTKVIVLFPGCIYDMNEKNLIRDNNVVPLTMNERKIIELLGSYRYVNFTAEAIYNHIYFDQPFKDISLDSIRSIIKRLRKKLPDNCILHQRLLGYRLNILS